MSLKKRVVVTGMGMVSPIGNNVEESWNAAKRGSVESMRLHSLMRL